MFRLLGLLCLCYTTLLVATEYYNGNGGYPGGIPGAGLHPGDPGYRGLGSNGAGYHDAYQFCVPSAEDPDADCIPGEAGLNYPVYSQVPPTGFTCQGHPLPGYYADQETQCQVFHICQHDGRHDSFLCPNGSIFNQQYFVCDWWYNFDCATAAGFYEINAELYQEPGFYGGAYSPAGLPGHAHQHAGQALLNGYGSPRDPLAPYPNGRHGSPRDPLAPYPNGRHGNGYGSAGDPLAPYPNGRQGNAYSGRLSDAYGPDPIHKAKLLPESAAPVNGY